MFQLKDKVVYPGHGVAIIDEIIEKLVVGKNIKFFKLNFLYKDMTILLPIHNLESSGARYPGDKKDIEVAINELYKIPKKKLDSLDFTPSGWNKRNKQYQNKIQSGILVDLAQIYRDLMYIAKQKDLSFGEKRMLQIAEELFIQEIQLVTKKDRDLILEEIRGPFKQFYFNRTKNDQSISTPA